MFEDLDDSGFVQQQKAEPPPKPQYQQNGYQGGNGGNNNGNGYGGNNGGGGGYGGQRQGGYGGGGGGGYGGKPPFNPKDDPIQDAYIPVALYVEKDYPEDIKTAMFNFVSKLASKNYVIRINADDKVFIDRLRTLVGEKLEVYLPWRGFNEIESKKTYNTNTCKDVASKHFLGWEKIPDSVKAILSSQVRMVFGDKNSSIILCLVIWSKDGASKGSEVTKETGRGGFIIKMASHYGFPIMNMSKPQAAAILEKTFSLV